MEIVFRIMNVAYILVYSKHMKNLLTITMICGLAVTTGCDLKSYCSRPGLNVQLLGFDTSATSAIRVNSYQSNTYNTVPFDSFAITDFNQYPTKGVNVSEGYDYVIVLPAINKKITIK